MKKIRFAIAQMNPTVGDFSANTRKIISWIKAAERKKADLIVFPELALCGYPVWDLANKKGFVKAGLAGLKKIVEATRGLRVTACVGFIDSPAESHLLGLKDPAGEKGRFRTSGSGDSYNALAWIEKGRLRQKQYKQLLPTYDVFLEDIFFEPGNSGRVIPWSKARVAPTICEDIWDERYDEKPLYELKKKGAGLAVNISASPYYRGVAEMRDSLVRRQSLRCGLPILYVNQVGAQDDLIFDGRSFFTDAEGKVLFRAPAFEEGLFFFDWNPAAPSCSLGLDAHSPQPEEMYRALQLGIRDYFRKNNFHKAVIGLSGGIDSALVAALAVDALGAKSVCGVTMPGSYSSRGSWEDSRELARRLGIEFRVNPIKEKYRFMVKAYKNQKKKAGRPVPPAGRITLAMENLQARLRGLELMYISNDEGRLLLTTGNKSELAVGYCTLYGDMAGGLAVLGDVYKTDVYRLCRYRNSLGEVIPEAILEKAPSAELRPGQKDQDSLPPYDILDEILYLYIEENRSRDEIISILKARKVPARMVAEVVRKVDHNEYKRRQTPPILRVTAKAWFGRRMPITNRFDR